MLPENAVFTTDCGVSAPGRHLLDSSHKQKSDCNSQMNWRRDVYRREVINAHTCVR